MASATDPAKDPAGDTPKPKKSVVESVITMTPVIMTIVATLLAGMSASEQTQAQYFRTVAGQNQSKVGDQWGFFQAKKMRGTAMETAVDLLPVTARPGPLNPRLIRVKAVRLDRLLGEAQTRARDLEKSPDTNVVGAAREFLSEAKNAKLDSFLKTLDAELDKNKSAFAYLGTRKLPTPNPKDLATNDPRFKEAVEDPALKETIKAIRNREPEKDIALKVRKVKEETLELALEAAEKVGPAFDKASEPVENFLKSLNKTVSEPIRLAALYHFLVIDVDTAPVPVAGNSGPKEVKAVRDLNEPLTAAANDLKNLIRGTQHDYNARRYSAEARNNLNTAMMYEVQVHRSSAEADRHRERSKLFFYGMLGAQCGVAISTITLAARKKGILWSLAAAAGLIAISFSGYVFLAR
jgi:hypothetical protein